MSTIFGTSARDSIVGTAGEDTIWAYQGGRDTIAGLEGDDFISFDGELNENDQVDGGEGDDMVRIEGNYLGGLVFTATTLVNVEELFLDGGFNYNLTLHDATAGDRFTVNANALYLGGALVLDASAETSARLFIETDAGDDVLTAGAGNDDIHPGAGSDIVVAGAGDDLVGMFGDFDPTDSLSLGDGYDSVWMLGDYSAGLTITGAMLTGAEEFSLSAGFDAEVAIADDLTAAQSSMLFWVNAFTVTGESITVDISAETDALWTLEGGLSDDTFIGGALGDLFEFREARSGNDGIDVVEGNGGDDVITFNETFTRDDQIDGGAGFDRLTLAGDYSAGVNFNAGTLRRVEEIVLVGRHSYALTLGDNNVDVDGFTVLGGDLAYGENLAYDGSAESISDVNIVAGFGDDTLAAGGGDDTLVSGAGDDILTAGAGDDVLEFGEWFGRDDQVDGGDGFDRLLLEGDHSAGVNFASTTLSHVEQIELAAGFDYDLSPGNNNVTADGFTVLGDLLGAGDTLAYDGSAESVSDVIVLGGAGADTLTAGGGDDSLHGGEGGDSLTGGAGDDTINGALGRDTIAGGLGTDKTRGGENPTTFIFTGVAESTGAGRDWVDVLKPLKDDFDLDVTVTGVDPRVNARTMTEATLDFTLGAEIGAAQLAAGHAVVFKPSAGDLAGHFFLVVDANGVAGYQGGEDYVFEFAAGSHPNAMASGMFV